MYDYRIIPNGDRSDPAINKARANLGLEGSDCFQVTFGGKPIALEALRPYHGDLTLEEAAKAYVEEHNRELQEEVQNERILPY